MNIQQAKQEIKNTIGAYLMKDGYGIYKIPSIRQRPVLLMGPPGVGKTQIMEQIARECGIALVSYTITHHTRQSAVGLPFISEKDYGGKAYSVTEYTMSEIVAALYDRMEESGLKEGILFIDEINCVSETLAPAMLQFLQCKTFGNHRIPEGWVIVAAGNPPEYNKSVRDFDVVTLDRVREIVVEPDYGAWKEYAYLASIHPAILSYLNARKEDFCLIETTVDGRRFATPRGWEDLSVLLYVYEEMGLTAGREVVYEYIRHPRLAKEFANYLELYRKYQEDYEIEEILSGTIREPACDRIRNAPFDEKLGVMSGILSRLNGQFGDICRQEAFLEQLMGIFKRFRQELEGAPEVSDGGGGLLSAIEEETALEYRRKQSAHLLAPEDEHRYRRILDTLNCCGQELRKAGHTEKGEVWGCVKALFQREDASYGVLFEKGGQMLEHAFDFFEASFGNSQEMALFITELNTGFYSVAFLRQYSCERYFQYNKNLLFDEQERQIQQAISRRLPDIP